MFASRPNKVQPTLTVEMKAAIVQLDGKELRERNIRVKKAVEKKRLEKKKNRFNKQAPETVNQKNAANRVQNKKIKESIAEKNKPARHAEPARPEKTKKVVVEDE